METYKLVLPGHLNHYGYLFGGHMLKWVDEYSWIAASTDYPDCTFVTIGLDKVEFRKSVQQGAILRFDINMTQEGNTSVTYLVNVYRKSIECCEELHVFSTNVTFVNIDEQGNKVQLIK